MLQHLYAVEHRTRNSDTYIAIIDGEEAAYAFAAQILVNRLKEWHPHWEDSDSLDEDEEGILHLIAVSRFEEAVALAQSRMRDYDNGEEEYIAVHHVRNALKYSNTDLKKVAEDAMTVMIKRSGGR